MLSSESNADSILDQVRNWKKQGKQESIKQSIDSIKGGRCRLVEIQQQEGNFQAIATSKTSLSQLELKH